MYEKMDKTTNDEHSGVIYKRYKVHDTEGNREYWNEFNIRMRRTRRDNDSWSSYNDYEEGRISYSEYLMGL